MTRQKSAVGKRLGVEREPARLLKEWRDYFAFTLGEAEFPPDHLYARTCRYLGEYDARLGEGFDAGVVGVKR